MTGIWRYAGVCQLLAWLIVGALVLTLGPACASWDKADPKDVEAIECLLGGGDWADGECIYTPDPEPTPTPKPKPTPTPPPPAEFLPPTAAELAAAGKRVEIKPVREGKRGMGATPRGQFGRAYYCQPEVAWPEACEAGRSFGPVAPDGHPKRVAWEAHFMGQRCATFSFESDTHMSYDPWISIKGVNQNHPRNVRVCGQGQFATHYSWIGEIGPGGRPYIIEGQWSWATAHGNGRVCAFARDRVGYFCIKYIER